MEPEDAVKDIFELTDVNCTGQDATELIEHIAEKNVANSIACQDLILFARQIPIDLMELFQTDLRELSGKFQIGFLEKLIF